MACLMLVFSVGVIPWFWSVCWLVSMGCLCFFGFVVLLYSLLTLYLFCRYLSVLFF